MCAAPCAAVTGPLRSGLWAFLLARTTGYAAAGAVAAGSVGALAGWSQWSPALRPLWAAVHLATMVLGLWMLWQGRQPRWMSAMGRSGDMPAAGNTAGNWQTLRGPCGLRPQAACGWRGHVGSCSRRCWWHRWRAVRRAALRPWPVLRWPRRRAWWLRPGSGDGCSATATWPARKQALRWCAQPCLVGARVRLCAGPRCVAPGGGVLRLRTDALT